MIIDTNTQGAPLLPADSGKPSSASALSPDEVEALCKSGCFVLDLRRASSFGEAHIPGSYHVDFINSAALNWIGVAVPPGERLVLILPPDKTFADLATELHRIGFDQLEGWLDGGIEAWSASGRETASLPRITATELRERLALPNPPTLIDVRRPDEFNAARIDGAINLPFDHFVELETCPVPTDMDVVVVCQSGFRASIAGSILLAQGCERIHLLDGGMIAWQN